MKYIHLCTYTSLTTDARTSDTAKKACCFARTTLPVIIITQFKQLTLTLSYALQVNTSTIHV